MLISFEHQKSTERDSYSLSANSVVDKNSYSLSLREFYYTYTYILRLTHKVEKLLHSPLIIFLLYAIIAYISVLSGGHAIFFSKIVIKRALASESSFIRNIQDTMIRMSKQIGRVIQSFDSKVCIGCHR